MRQTLQLGREGFVDGGRPSFLIRDRLDWSLAVPILLRRFATAHEIARVWDRRAPVVGKALEVGERKPGQILAGNAYNPKLTQCVEQKAHLLLAQRAAQIDTREAHPSSTLGQRIFAVCINAKQRLQSLDQRLIFQCMIHN